MTNHFALLRGAALILALAVFSPAVWCADEKKSQHENPSHKNAYQERMRLRNEGVAHYQSGVALKKALASFQGALALKKDSAIEHYNLGVVFRKQNDIEQATTYFEQALKLQADLAPAYYSLGLIARERGDIDSALNYFERTAKLVPGQASAHYQISRLYREQGKPDKALQAIVNTLQLDPYHTGALYQLYLYHQQHGDEAEAQRLFKEFSRLKRALGKTRKEINPDESELALPIDSERGRAVEAFSGSGTVPLLAPRNLLPDRRLSAYDLMDLNRDGYVDLVAAAMPGAAAAKVAVMLNQAGKGFKPDHEIIYNGAGPIHFVEAATLVREGGADIVIATDTGIYIARAAAGEENKEKNPTKPASFNEKLSPVGARHLHLVDIDHDGDVDILADAFQQVLINQGNGVFEKQDEYFDKALVKELKTYRGDMVGSDFRNLIAVDFVAVANDGRRRLLRDDMGGRYTPVEALKAIDAAEWQGRGDMDNDGWTDIVNLTGSELSIDFNSGNHRFTKVSAGRVADGQRQQSGLVGDFNNDGFKDVLTALETGGVNVWVNQGGRKFKLSEVVGGEAQKRLYHQLKLFDFNDDGLLDVAGLDRSGALRILLNESKTDTHWLKFDLEGMRSAPDGQYTQVEVRHGTFYSKYEATGDTLHIPLGRAQYAEIVRITWPNGFVENKFKVDGGKRWTFEESERVSGSCPSIYTWAGGRFNYVTDAFISGPMGVPAGQGRYFPVDHDEYIKIPAELMERQEAFAADKKSKEYYHISIVEELKETTYIDQVRLFAVDRPQRVGIFPNEYLKPADFPAFHVHATAATEAGSATVIQSARDHRGRDVAELIKAVDHRYPHQFRRSQYTGFAEPNGVEIELSAQAVQSPNLRLFLTGWFYYFDSTSLVSAAQRPDLNMVWPQIQVQVNGRWETVKDIGLPSGKGKTLVVDLAGLIPPASRKLRVWSNFELYWDRILVDIAPPPPYTLRELPLEQARLRFHGFSTLLRDEHNPQPLPDRFDYHRTGYASFWNPLRGRYTRYGKVDTLLHTEDSLMAVFGSGDELALTFGAGNLPPLAQGWQRDFIVYLNGYVKDGDKYTVHAGSVEPMPFAGMKAYPYSEADQKNHPFNSPEYKQYQQRYQTREPLQFTQPRL